jgi:hypothetical protein
MNVLLVVGTDKGGFLVRSDAARARWTVEGPLFKGCRLRRHVLCFHNQENTRWFESLDRPVATGDVIMIIQAVSGGA